MVLRSMPSLYMSHRGESSRSLATRSFKVATTKSTSSSVVKRPMVMRSELCASASGGTTTAGTSARGEKGMAQRVTCKLADGTPVKVDLGFSRNPEPVQWSGGEVRGTIAPGGRVVSAEPLAGLEPLATPDPRDLPNNHLAYAGQWFFFALTALVIYILALRRRRKVS